MSTEASPEPISFEPGSGALPAALEPALIDSYSPILLLVAPDTGDAAVRTAVGLADGRARAGKTTVLADAAARAPRLHELLDVANLEGLADVFFFGASLERVRTRPETRAFDFVPVGAYVPDPAAVLDSSRWDVLARAMEAEGASLLVFVPAGSPGLGSLTERVGRAVLIGDPRSVERISKQLDPSCEVVAVVEPALAVAPDRLSEAAGSGAPGTSTIFDEPELTEPVVFRSERPRRKSVSPVLLVLLLATLAAAGWYAYQEYLAPASVTTAAQPAETVPSAPVRGEALETPIPVSVAVEAHQDFETAQERLRALSRAEPDVRFYLAPLAVRGVIFYRLLAGPVTDRESGERLMARLVEAELKTAADPWAVRPTEQAYHLGEYDTAADARARVDSLAAVAIPSYVVPIRHDPGPDRYRVYGGAYESAAEAEVMREMLEEAGIEARLIPRTGEPIAEGP